MLLRKSYNSHITSTGTTTEDMGLKAAANMIGISRSYAYKLARKGTLQVTRKVDGKAFVSKKSVKMQARKQS